MGNTDNIRPWKTLSIARKHAQDCGGKVVFYGAYRTAKGSGYIVLGDLHPEFGRFYLHKGGSGYDLREVL